MFGGAWEYEAESIMIRSASESVCRRDQGAAIRRIGSAVAAIGSDHEIGFGPRSIESPGAFHGADDVITALHDHAWDVAYAALFLHSDESAFITGVVLPVDGGQSARIG